MLRRYCHKNIRIAFALAGGTLLVAAPALADVKAGVDAWARGDYPVAVREWRGPATAGDPDAMFNLAQAYRLGRGVEKNEKQAEILYAKAAAKGHLKASDNYGLLLFQSGRQAEAVPYVEKAAERGDPRSQYLLGIAHFNGELVPKDWPRAYALLTLANAAGLPQAPPALKQMDDFIPLADRQAAQLLAQNMKRDADGIRAQQLAAADLSEVASVATPPATSVVPSRNGPPRVPTAVAPARSATPAGTVVRSAPVQIAQPRRLPQAIPSTRVPPSVAAARAAVEEAERVTGTQTPATAGADFARPPTSPPVRVARTNPSSVVAPVRRATPARKAPAPASQPNSANGPWRVQLGAFSVRGNADRLWSKLSGNSALSGKEKFVVPAGRIVRLQAGGFASRGAAQNACNAVKRSGQACLVTRP
ncbi:MAG: SPOR domain-containing protein [Parerythrobacter sp.]